MDILFDHAILTHILTFVLGVPVGFVLDRILLHSSKKITIDIKAFFVSLIHSIVLSLYIVTLVHAQFFGGTPPSIIFSGFAAISFGSIVGERDRIIELIRAFKGGK